jgi:hypothetical protein
MSEFMCKLCFRNGKEIGQIAGEHWLVYNEGNYHIINNQGCGCDVIFTFSKIPIEDPFPDDKEDFTEAEWVEVCNLRPRTYVKCDKLKFCVQDAVRLFNECSKAGYTTKFGPCEYWVHEKCAILIKNYLLKHGSI